MSREFDHGMLNLPRGHRARGKSIEAEIAAWKRAEARRGREAARRATTERKAARDAEAARVKLTGEDIAGARYVRNEFGWHRVVRVNKTTVSVETGYSWVDRLSFTKILEVR